ncbi:MAG: YaaC family protein [Leifsonia sp.]|uniref:YaaC family protein n=1 Tax=Leifsonia sp. TaxID=1870902 RepID=UPI003F8083EB
MVAGVGSFSRPISPRASVADLWSTLDIAAAAGETALQRAGSPRLDQQARSRLKAYVNQARQYYEAATPADPVAKPLLGYYFVLNAAKAYLTAIDPDTTAANSLMHGIGQDPAGPGTPYDFYQERFKVSKSGVFQLLAAKTGRGFSWQPGVMQLSRLMPYLAESTDLFSSSFGTPPALVPIESVRVESEGSRPNKQAWLTVEVSRNVLREASLTPRGLLARAAAFADSFDLVDAGSGPTATYQLTKTVAYAQMPGPLAELRAAFDRSLIVRNRSLAQPRDSVTLSPHLNLVSTEAITFAVMLHLSNMVRYRPHHVEELRGSGHWWLFTSWVDRACENFLLAVSSRIALEEHLVG